MIHLVGIDEKMALADSPWCYYNCIVINSSYMIMIMIMIMMMMVIIMIMIMIMIIMIMIVTM
jgi:hypothetical protein